MKSFWNIFVHKALDLFDARSIVEIGSDDGLNTKNLLAFVKEKKAQLYVVDPAPKYTPNDFFEDHQEYAKYYGMLSLNFLASHDVCDAYLIDGDHNWYTVYNELKIIDKKVSESKKLFPLIMFHDTGWPYARRDLYYNPENIPPAHINPYKRFGILPNQAELIAGEGLNDGCAHSIYEGTPHNGVLTAIEDFLDEAQEDFIFINFSVKFGFSLLVERNVAKSNPAFFDWICDLQNKTIANDIMSFIELERTTALIEQVKNEKNANIEMKLAQDELAAAYTESHELRCASDAVQEKLYSTQTELQQTQVDLAAAQTKVNAFQETIERAMCEVGQLQADLAVVYTESNELRCARDDLQENLYSTQEELQKTQVDLAAAQSEGNAFQETIERTLCEVTQLQSELVQAQNDLTSAYIDAHRLRGECEAALGETSVRAALEAELTQAQDDLASAYIEVHSLHAKKDSLQGQVNALHNSLSWAVTAPLRLVYDVLAAPFRAVANFNLRRTLYAFRYNFVGNMLYRFFVPQTVKNRINRAWVGKSNIQHTSDQQKSSISYEQITSSTSTLRDPVFIPDPARYEEKSPMPLGDCSVKLIAFYLPQFHPFPENDAWWGEGFTEWTNVTKAKPLFDGHYQPKLPGAMGFYDLRLPEVLRKQAKLAKEFGIHGFCFHHYYFAGKRLMETPVNNLLANPDIDLPFCLCWANENWTRRWDGMDQDILIAQEHSPKDDIRFLEDIQKYFDDPRYIKVDDKPFLIIYKANQFPDMAATIKRWREYMQKKGRGLYVVMAQTFGELDPRPYGFDAAVEFPPHQLYNLNRVTGNQIGLYSDFEGIVFDYSENGNDLCSFKNDYVLFKTTCPTWDNTARRKKSSHIFVNSTPMVYAKRLSGNIQYSVDHLSTEKCFTFINAWNEWAEGAYLEPDSVYGYAYLNATSKAFASFNDFSPMQSNFSHVGDMNLLFVLHDCHRAGAQIWALTLLRWLKKYTKISIRILALNTGPLEKEFSGLFPLKLFSETTTIGDLEEFCCGVPDVVYGNTVVSPAVYPLLAKWETKYITHVHEMEDSIQKYTTEEIRSEMLRYTDFYIGASDAVKRNLVRAHGISSDAISTVYAFIASKYHCGVSYEKNELRKRLNIPLDACVILGCGSRTSRKGTDIFIRIASQILKTLPHPVFFCWVGWGENTLVPPPTELIDQLGIGASVQLVPEIETPDLYFRAADIFALPSREDPFPLVCLEAADAGLPIVCFADAGGMPDFVENDAGIVVPYIDETAFCVALQQLVIDTAQRERLGQQARRKFLSRHTDDIGARQVLARIRAVANKPHPVTVIVPNYNYAQFLDARLDSIATQSYKDYECILLDDASMDNSAAVLEKWKEQLNAQLVINTVNSGKPCVQWKKGIEKAAGRFIWIAEADDLCDENFLESMLAPFMDANVVLAYAIPSIIDAHGDVVHIDYRTNYLSYASKTRWQASFVCDGQQEITEALGVVNTIPNVSATLFRKPADSSIIDTSLEMRCSGDWMFYLRLAMTGRVAYVHTANASHRRHNKSIVAQDKENSILIEELLQIYAFVLQHFDVSSQQRSKMTAFQDSLLGDRKLGAKNFGFCPACEKQSAFTSAEEWLRDHYRCQSCGSLPRDRALHKVLLDSVPHLMEAKCLEFAPSNDFLAKKVNDYTPSHYYPNFLLNTVVQGALNLNMEQITAPDESYDLIVHEDILEHLFDPCAALRECIRVCKFGGHILFTVPIDNTRAKTVQRSSRNEDGSITHHYEQVFHGNPVGDGQCLVVWDYGQDFEEYIKEWIEGYPVIFNRVNEDYPHYGIEGKYLDVIFLKKIDETGC